MQTCLHVSTNISFKVNSDGSPLPKNLMDPTSNSFVALRNCPSRNKPIYFCVYNLRWGFNWRFVAFNWRPVRGLPSSHCSSVLRCKYGAALLGMRCSRKGTHINEQYDAVYVFFKYLWHLRTLESVCSYLWILVHPIFIIKGPPVQLKQYLSPRVMTFHEITNMDKNAKWEMARFNVVLVPSVPILFCEPLRWHLCVASYGLYICPYTHTKKNVGFRPHGHHGSYQIYRYSHGSGTCYRVGIPLIEDVVWKW